MSTAAPIMQQPQPSSLRKLVFWATLQLSTIWDLVTTFLGILLILERLNPVSVSLAVIGTLTVGALSLSTRAIWQRRQHYSVRGLPLGLLRLVWVMAIIVDLWTSLTCNAWFVGGYSRQDSLALVDLLGGLGLGQFVLVLFITSVTVVSPILMGYLRDRDIDTWLS
jgi:hypothetical protein